MTTLRTHASVLAVVAVAGGVTFIAGSAALASTVAGVWAGVTVVGATVCIGATIGLYTVGVVDQVNDRDRDRDTDHR